MRSAVYLGIAASILTLTLIATSCDRATDPRAPAPMSFDVLILDEGSGGGNQYFVYNTSSKSVTDSFRIGQFGGFAALSPDGSVIYAHMRDSIAVLDVTSKQKIGTLQAHLGIPTPIWIIPSSDGRFVLSSSRDSGLHIFNADDYTLYARLPGAFPEIQDYSLSRDGKKLYTINRLNRVRVYRMEDTLIQELQLTTSGHMTARVRGNSEGTLIALQTVDLSAPSSLRTHFEVYDVTSGVMIFDTIITPANGHIRFSPDEKLIFHSNPGIPLIGPIGDFHLRVYDIEQNRITHDIDTEGGLLSHYRVTPDGKWLIGVQFECGARITVIDLEKMALDTVIRIEFNNNCFNWVLGEL